jgi:hypothetical protein
VDRPLAEGLTTVTTNTREPSGCIGLGPRIRLTRLPFGGAVLVNETTLALVECAERDADALGRLLSGEHPGPGPEGADLRRVAAELLRSRWLVVTDEAK